MTSLTPTGLPGFNAEDPVWADLLWSAARRRNDQSIVALADHCRRHDAEPVLRWLEDGPGTYRWLAGRLLVEGVPADEGHTAAFVSSLDHSLRGDLTMTHLAAAEFLDLAARIRIPEVRETLGAAVQDAVWDWPWSLGPAIATALAAHDPETVTRIAREMITDAGTGVCARVSAAGVLAKADERHIATAVDTIRAASAADRRSHEWHAIEVLVDLAPRLTDDIVGQVAEMVRDVIRTCPLPSTQVAAARLLIRLGPRYTTEAVGLLRHLPSGDDDSKEGEERAQAAMGLLEVDPPHTDEAIALLREVLADQYANRYDQLHAATTLGELGPRYEDEAADAVRAVAASTHERPSATVAAARTLAGLGRRNSAEAGRILRAVLARSAQSDSDVEAELPVLTSTRWPDTTRRPDTGAAAELAALGPPYTAEAVGILRNMIPGHGRPVDADRSVHASWALANVGPHHVGAATGALRRVLARSALDAYARVRIVQTLAELDQRHDADITAALHTVAADPGIAKPFPLTYPLRELARDHPQHTAEVADALRAALHTAVTRQAPAERGAILGAVGELTRLSAGHTAGAADVLRAVITNPADASERIRAAATLAQLDPAAIPEVIEMLGSQITDPSVEPHHGRHALVELTHYGRDHQGRVVDALRQLLGNPRLDAHTRIRAVLNLAELDQRHDNDTADITAALHAVAANPDTDEPYLLISQLRDLARNRPRHTNHAAAALLAVTTQTATDPLTRVHGAKILPQLGPQHTSDAAEILRAVLADPTTAPPPAISAASALAALGPDYATEALQALHALAADSEAAQRARLEAARAIRHLESSS